MRKQLSFGVILFSVWVGSLFSPCIVASSWAVTSADLSRPWLDRSGQLTQADIDRLVAVMREDRETNQLLEDVYAKMGLSGPGELGKILTLCASDVSDVGRYIPRVEQHWEALSPDDEKFSWSIDTQRSMRSAMSAAETTRATYHDLLIFNAGVCMKDQAGEAVGGAVYTLIHELTHLLKTDELVRRNESITRYSGPEEYAYAEVMRPGGEVDAYTAEYGVHKRLKKTMPGLQTFTIERFLGDDGELKDREGLALYLLDWYYRKFYAAWYLKQLKGQMDNAEILISWHQGPLKETMKLNLSIVKGNIQLHEGELSRMRRGSNQYRKESEALAKAKHDHDFYEKYLRDIETETARMRDELSAMQEKWERYGPRGAQN